jgi:IrrE N-terminal-like domain
VVERYADVEFDSIPGSCDAVVIGLMKSRPTVVVDRDQPPRRLRFSLGHELGHILVPGHAGIATCHMASEYYYAASLKEREAHAFASEVLVPTRWLSEVAATSSSVTEVLEAVQAADVSAAAGCLAAVRVLPPGSVIALMSNTRVEMALASPDTYANLPPQDQGLDARHLDEFSDARGQASLSGRAVRWWVFPSATDLEDETDDRTASEVLWEIVLALYPDEPAQRKAFMSVSGVSGNAKGTYPYRTVEELYAILRARFTSRGDRAQIVEHPLFDTYLVKRARELFLKT